MPELVINRGVPGSGKSTYAMAWVNAAPNRVRSNRDDIRKAGYGVYFGPPIDEDVVTKIQHAGIRAALLAGVSVIVDDCNIEMKYIKQLAHLAYECDATPKIELHDVPLDVALQRNAQRDRVVPEPVIRKMHSRLQGLKNVELPERPVFKKYEGTPGKKKAALVDLDGTLAKMNGRGPFEWHRVIEDEIVQDIRELVDMYFIEGYEIIVMSGRDSVCRDMTIEWLDHHEIEYTEVLMRPQGDMRKDNIVKHELFWENVAPNYDVKIAIDDRNQVVSMWRFIGLTCLQVADGNF